jgi:hypothetical protein
LLIFFTEVIKFYWLMLLLYPGELYRFLGVSSLFWTIYRPKIKPKICIGKTVYMYHTYRCNAFLAHLAFRPCELLSSLFVLRPSINISHFNLLLTNHWANCNQTLVEWSLDGPLPKLCPVIPTSNQDGRQAKKRGMKF